MSEGLDPRIYLALPREKPRRAAPRDESPAQPELKKSRPVKKARRPKAPEPEVGAAEVYDPLDDPETEEELAERGIKLADSYLTTRAKRWITERNFGPGIEKKLRARLVEEAETKHRQLRLVEVQAVHQRILQELKEETQRRAAEEAQKRARSLGERPMEYQAHQWFLNDQRSSAVWPRAIEAAEKLGRALNLAEVQKLVAETEADEERAREDRRRERETLLNRRPDETAATASKEELFCRALDCNTEIAPWVENVVKGGEILRFPSSGPYAGKPIPTGCFAVQYDKTTGRAYVAGFCDPHRPVYREAMLGAGFDERLFPYGEAKRMADEHNRPLNGVADLIARARRPGPARPARDAMMHGGAMPPPNQSPDRSDKRRFQGG